MSARETIMPFKTYRLFCAIICLPLLLAACQGGHRHRHMQQQLDSLQALNQADSLLTDDSLAQALADWFDDHGTPNEQMEAHYLLGRTYADRGEAPAALAAYHDAIDRADTAAADCDYRQLAKVQGQTGALLYWQQLPEAAMRSYDMAYRYSMKCRDTLLAVAFYEQKANCYSDMEQYDSAAMIIRKVRNLYLRHGDTLSANTAVGPMVFFAVKAGRMEEAHHYINIYGSGSRAASDTVRYSEAWAQFMIHRGLYYMCLHSTDSAVAYFRRGLSAAREINNRIHAYDGLYTAYKELGMGDSIVKYAELRTEAGDSAIVLGITEHMQQMQSLYDYDRISKRAMKAEQETEREKAKNTILCLLLALMAIMVLLAVVAAIIPGLRRKIAIQGRWVRFVVDKMLYDRLHAEQEGVQAYCSANESEMEEFLRNSLSKQGEGLEAEVLSVSFLENDVVQEIKEYGDKGKILPEPYWTRLRTAVNIYAPGFIGQLEKLHPCMDITEKNICMLALVSNMSQKSKASAIGQDYHALAMKRKRLYGELFGKEGSAKDLDECLRKMAFGA